VGALQCLALWRGMSRSMVTMLGGLVVGLPLVEAAELSFLLGLPTLGAASAYALVANLRHAHAEGRPDLFHALGVGPTLLGVAVATASAMLAVRWLVGFLSRRGLAPFGWYRIGLAIVLAVAAARAWIAIGVGSP